MALNTLSIAAFNINKLSLSVQSFKCCMFWLSAEIVKGTIWGATYNPPYLREHILVH